jgi:hypothetical protein
MPDAAAVALPTYHEVHLTAACPLCASEGVLSLSMQLEDQAAWRLSERVLRATVRVPADELLVSHFFRP